MTDLDRTLYLIYSGYGRDGGFGDYSGVSWSELPLSVDGAIVWFKSEDKAREIVKKLNQASRTTFYSDGTHGAYDGNFPLEYQYRAITVPSGPASRSDIFEKIQEQDKERWINVNYDPSYEEYENYLFENNLDETTSSYNDWLKLDDY